MKLMTEDEVYDLMCCGCMMEKECHDNCEYCDAVLEMLEEEEECAR